MSDHRQILVTGMGAVSGVGIGCDALWDAVASGRDGIRRIERFPTDEYATHLGAAVPGRDRADQYDPETGAQDLCTEFAVTAAREAWARAGLDSADVPPERIGIVLGTGLGDAEGCPHPLTEAVADALGICGVRLSASTACSSSTNAMGLARRLLLSGAADIVLAGGVDLLTPLVFAGFHELEILSAEKCAPFSFPFGTNLGDGAGFVVMESERVAGARGAEPIVEISGYGLSSDAFHETSPDPKGGGIARAVRWALADAGLEPDAVGYVNAHGTGTGANDRAEWQAIKRVLGPRAESVPVSSTKSIIAHAQGAAGVLESIVTIMAMGRGMVPQTLHHTEPRPHCPSDPVAGDRPRPHEYEHAVCQNSAFGGANGVVVISKPDARYRPERVPRRTGLELVGLGAVGPHGVELERFAKLLRGGRRVEGGVPPFRLEELVPRAEPRGIDPTTVFLTAAAAMALRDAGVAVKGSLRDRVGLIMGANRVSPASAAALHRSIDERGMARLAVGPFSRIVLNAPGGTCTKLLSLRGPHVAVSTGPGSGLTAIVVAAELLASMAGVDMLLASGVDELSAAEDGDVRGEGAGCVALAREGFGGAGSEPRIALAGWAIDGPGRLGQAVEQALDMAGLAQDDLGAAFVPDDLAPVLGRGDASSSALACVAATLALRRGEIDTALVTTGQDRPTPCALVLAVKGRDHGS